MKKRKFFTDKPKLLKLVLKHFLDLNSIQEIRITNPEIPGLEETNKQALKRIDSRFHGNSRESGNLLQLAGFWNEKIPAFTEVLFFWERQNF